MTPGDRLKYIRKRRGFTLKKLGISMGYSEGSADIRIAQYEANKRGQTEKVRKGLSKILGVQESNFSNHIAETPEDLFRSMVWIAEEYGRGTVFDCYLEWANIDTDREYGHINDEEAFRRKFIADKEEMIYVR